MQVDYNCSILCLHAIHEWPEVACSSTHVAKERWINTASLYSRAIDLMWYKECAKTMNMLWTLPEHHWLLRCGATQLEHYEVEVIHRFAVRRLGHTCRYLRSPDGLWQFSP